jgi:LysM repeat protein
MTFCSARCRWIVPILLAFYVAGCSLTSNDQDEKKEAHYLTGKNRQQSMDYKGAAEAFEKALEVNPQSSAAHLEVGLLYAEKLNEGVATEEERGRNLATAIYHLEKYIQLNPKSAWVVRIRGQIEGCKYELAKTAPFTLLPSTVQAELERLNSNNISLRQQIEQLKLQLIQQAHAYSNRLASLQTQTVTTARLASYSLENTTSLRTNVPSVDSSSLTKQLPLTTPRQMIASQKQPAPPSSKPSAALSRFPTGAVSRTHTVRSGETLASIARAHSLPLGSLMAANPGVEPRKLKVGQTLNLPALRS